MLKLKLQYFGHLMWRSDSFEKTLMLGKIKGKRRRGQQRMRWLNSITDSIDINLSKHEEIVGASLVAQTVKNLPAMPETQVQLLGWEEHLEKGMATHSSILAWRIPWTEEPGEDPMRPWGCKESWLSDSHTHTRDARGERSLVCYSPWGY